MPLFCRHNRFEASCPICSREKAPGNRARSASGRSPTGRRSEESPASRRHGSGSRAGHLVTRRVARATDDGYRHELVPGVKATADAERLAAALAVAAARLEFPGPHPEVVEAVEPLGLAFRLALGDATETDAERALEAFSRWTPPARDAGWTPQRRFARWFDRLALPGFGRAARFEFLVTLGAAGIHELEADALHVSVAHDDPTTLAAKRALSSGDAMLLERRARVLADGTGVPLAALDRGLALWDRTAPLEPPPHAEVRRALALP